MAWNAKQGCHAIATAMVVGTLAALTAVPLQAQGSGSGFLFQQPTGSFDIRAGYAWPRAGGDLFPFVTDQFTLNRSDFSGPTIGADVAIRVAPQFDAVLAASYTSTTRTSEYRHFVDLNNAPINQTTSFERIPVMASVRAYLTPRGRSVGRFAWVPARFTPYVGAGAGAVYYKFHQQGDFVDVTNNNNVFAGDFSSSRWTPAAQAMAGIDYSLTPRIALTGEAKYIIASGSVDQQSFTGFNSIDLSGLSTTAGLSFRF